MSVMVGRVQTLQESAVAAWTAVTQRKRRAVPADGALQGINQHGETDFREEQKEQKRGSMEKKGCDGDPTSFPTGLLPDDGRRQRDCHLHLWITAGRQNDGRFLDGSLHLVLLWCYDLKAGGTEKLSFWVLSSTKASFTTHTSL